MGAKNLTRPRRGCQSRARQDPADIDGTWSTKTSQPRKVATGNKKKSVRDCSDSGSIGGILDVQNPVRK